MPKSNSINIGFVVLFCVLASILVFTGRNAYKAFVLQFSSAPQSTAKIDDVSPTPITVQTSKPTITNSSSLEKALLLPELPVNARVRANGYTALMIAAQNGDVERTKILLEAGADPNITSNLDGGALGIAAKTGQVEIVNLLIKAGVNAKSAEGSRALSLAVSRGHANIVQALLNNGADPNTRIDIFGEVSQTCILKRAVWRDRLDIVQLLVTAKANPNLQDDDFHPILLSALMDETEGYGTSVIKPSFISKKRSQIVKTLIMSGADPNARSRHNGTSVLTAAVVKAPIEIVKLLIQKGAKVNTPGAYEQTPLMYAAELGSPEVVKLLLDNNANVNAVQQGVKGRTALYYAVEKGSLEVVKLLLEKKANVNAVIWELKKNSRGGLSPYKVTPLDKALTLKRSDIEALLIQHKAKTYSQLFSKP